MRRWAFHILAGLSLAFRLATLTLWHRSAGRHDTLAHWTTGGGPPAGGTDHQLTSWDGGICYRRSWNATRFSPQDRPVPTTVWSRLGFWARLSQSSDIGFRLGGEAVTVFVHHEVRVPHGFAATVFAVASAAWLRAAVRRRKRRAPRPVPRLRLRPDRQRLRCVPRMRVWF